MTGDRGRIAFVATCAVVIFYTLGRAWSVEWSEDGLPTWDSAGYLLEAVRFRDDLARFDLLGLAKDVTRPDLHPPLHSLFLALWLLIAGNSLWAARVYPLLAFAVGLAAVVATGVRMHPRRGWEIGAAAAVLATMGVSSLRLLSTPMTESTALPFQYLALWLAVRNVNRTDVAGRLQVGIAVLAATLVRYNIGPMLVAPLVLHHLWQHRRALTDPAERTALLDPGIALWGLPTALAFGLWQLVRPDLLENIQKFLENRSSGLDFWSVENLAWVPLTMESAYLGSWVLVAPLLVLFTLGLLRHLNDADRGGEQVVQWVVLVGGAALTWHDFKIERNLGPLLPGLYLCALAALAELPGLARLGGAARWAGLGGLLAARAGWGWTVSDDDLVKGADFRPDPPVREALDFLVKQAGTRERIWVVGYMFRLSPGLIEYWTRTHDVTAKLELNQPRYGEQTRTGVDASWNEQYATFVREQMLTEERLQDTTFVIIETVPGTHYFDDWKAYSNNYAKAFAAQSAVPEVDRLSFYDLGLTLHVYRANDTPTAAALDARATGPTAADDAGIALPPADALYRDPMRGGAASWLVYPPDAVGLVSLDRSGGALRITIPAALPHLQVCDAARPNPTQGPVRGVLNLRATGLTGRAWVHLRGMDEANTLQTAANGAPDIVQGGPLAADGAQPVEIDFSPAPTSTRVRPCLMLDGVTGSVEIADYALYAPDAPRLVGAVGAAPSTAPADVPAGVGGWRLVPPDAPGATLTTGAGSMTVRVEAPSPTLQVCGTALPYAGERKASFTLRAQGLTGKAWFHWRGLDAGGVLAKAADGGGAIIQSGPYSGDVSANPSSALTFPEGVRTVRPCLVLDGVTGTADLRGVGLEAE